MTSAAPRAEWRIDNDAPVLYVAGPWRLHDLPAIARVLSAAGPPSTAGCVIDGSGIEAIDTAGGFVLLKCLTDAGYPVGDGCFRGLDARHERLLSLVRARMTAGVADVRARRHGPLHDIGVAALAIVARLRRDAAFSGRVTMEIGGLLRRPARFRFRETLAQFEATCVAAIPIVMLINFLIGVVMAYVLGVEAQRYGADLFVADGVVLAVCRELSPMLVSVLVAGRSGAAFTAQIGTMKVEEEVDAITTMGLSPIQVLVIPRVLALMLAMPLLVLVGDIAGILGGMLVCSTLLNVPPDAFVDRVHAVLEMRHLLVGVGKAPVFALFIAMIASRMGLAVERDARSVGEGTTSTVVQCIVWVIVLDALFAVLLQWLDI